MFNEVQTALKSIRPYLQADNGDIELVEISDDGIVKVRLTGECKNCPMSQMTLRAGIERAILKDVPGVRRVEAID